MNVIQHVSLSSLDEERPFPGGMESREYMRQCRFMLEHHGHAPGVELVVCHERQAQEQWRLDWTPEDGDSKPFSRETETSLQKSALAIAYLLFRASTSYATIEEAVGMDGVDYYLCERDDPFGSTCARLVVLGVDSADQATLTHVLTVEKTRLERRDSCPAYIVVVEHSMPMAAMAVIGT